MFLSALSCIGMTATIMVRNLKMGQLPAILVIGKTRSTCEVLSMIHSNLSREELLNKLIDTVNMYSDQREVEVREENERAAREQMKMEQDEAYYESLEADRLKEEAKRQKEHAMQTERKRAESERQEQEALREANRLDAEQEVPPEPAVGEAGCTKIRIRQPTGEFFERRFLGTSPLRHLLKYVASKGYPTDEYKLISSFPRRDVSSIRCEHFVILKLHNSLFTAHVNGVQRNTCPLQAVSSGNCDPRGTMMCFLFGTKSTSIVFVRVCSSGPHLYRLLFKRAT